MSDTKPGTYCLTITRWQNGTSFCIWASSDEEAIRKAARIAEYFDVTDADVVISRGSVLISQSGRRAPPPSADRRQRSFLAAASA